MSTNPGTTVIPLGTGGYIPTRERHTASVLVRRGDSALLLDAGTGIARLLEPTFQAHLSGVRCLNVVVSHYHLDHVIGLTWLPKVWNSKVCLFAPSKPLVEVRAEDALQRLTGAPLFALPFEAFPFPTELRVIAKEDALQIGDFHVRLLRQRHPGGSVGFRVDDCFAYVTDTDPEESHIPFVAGVELAFMDAFYDSTEYGTRSREPNEKLEHGCSLTVAATAKAAGVTQLGLIHLNPSYEHWRCEALLDEARSIFSSSIIPDEGVPISL